MIQPVIFEAAMVFPPSSSEGTPEPTSAGDVVIIFFIFAVLALFAVGLTRTK